jgi:hypothetical protein
MRTYYRASGGVDGAIQTLLFWAVLLTAPIWIPAIGLYLLWQLLFAPTPLPSDCSGLLHSITYQSTPEEIKRINDRRAALNCFTTTKGKP